MSSNSFAGAIWTNHALERLSEREISKEMASRTFNNPDIQKEGKKPGTTELIKKFDSVTVTLISKRNNKNEWVIISAWIDPPVPGSEDNRRKEEYLNYKKATGWKKFFLTIKRQLGI